MLTPSISFQVVKEDRVYSLNFPNNAPLGEIHDSLFQMRSLVVDKINEALKMDKPQEPQPEKKE